MMCNHVSPSIGSAFGRGNIWLDSTGSVSNGDPRKVPMADMCDYSPLFIVNI